MTSLIWRLHPGTLSPSGLRSACNIWPSALVPVWSPECECCAVPPVLMFWLDFGPLVTTEMSAGHWTVAETSYCRQTCSAHHAQILWDCTPFSWGICLCLPCCHLCLSLQSNLTLAAPWWSVQGSSQVESVLSPFPLSTAVKTHQS